MAAFLNKKFKLVSSEKFDEYMQELSELTFLLNYIYVMLNIKFDVYWESKF